MTATTITSEASLGDLPAGCEGRVLGVDGNDPLAQRLWDLGFWPGTHIQVVRRAPFGGPTQCRMRGYRLALRRDEAARVRVRVENQR